MCYMRGMKSCKIPTLELRSLWLLLKTMFGALLFVHHKSSKFLSFLFLRFLK